MDAAAILACPGTLAVFRTTPAGPELFVVVDGTGVTAFNGHVDLGTGIATALAQVVAEELDVDVRRVRTVLGSIGLGPDQGATIASTTLQVTAIPLRAAAAQAHAALLALAADELGAPAAALSVTDGTVAAGDNRFTTYAALLAARQIHLELDPATPTKPPDQYRVVGQPIPRMDIPAKATGGLVYVQDMRVPGMVHGRVVRPPYAGLDAGPMVGRSLLAVDEASLAGIPGLLAVVTEGDFVGVVAEREEHAVLAAERLHVTWRPGPPAPDLRAGPEPAIRANPRTPRTLKDTGDLPAVLAAAAARLTRTYVWPFQMHASIGPSCSLADWRDDGLTVWSGTQNPHHLRADLALLLDLPADRIAVHRMETAGCYGRNCADDVGADAALLSRAVRRPVRVQLSRAQEHLWEPKGAAQLMDVDGGLDAAGNPAAYDFRTAYPSNRAPTLALLLTGRIPPVPAVVEMGDRTAIPPYAVSAMRVVVDDMAPIVRAAWLRGVSALPNTFAHESYIDELAAAAGTDPLQFRLRHLTDARGAELLRATAAQAGWHPRTAPRRQGGADGLLHGQGVAYAQYVHSTFPGFGAAWSAWVAEVAVDPASGAVSVSRVTAGQDSGLMVNPDGVRHQLHGNVIQSISRAVKEEVRFDAAGVASREWGAYPILTFPELPTIDALLLPRPGEPPMGAGESASVPSAAAIANAIYDATGVRFREVPFTPERIKAGLAAAALPPPPATPPRARGWKAALAGLLTGATAVALAALPFRAAIDPVPRTPGLYSAATVERGRILAALGNCVTCHTALGGTPWAGGHTLRTPFGTIATPNLTPDEATGIGTWSYAAFARAMREGIGRDGRHLYPALPYTAFRTITDPDLEALYAFLMSQAPVSAPRQPTALRFPFNLRPLLAGWNALFLRGAPFMPDPSRSAAWNRGAYLVQGLGHCGACHTPRNALGAEKGGAATLAGAVVDGWQTHALNGRGPAPLPWTEDDVFDYLRTGFSARHGPAAGPMAAVVTELAAVPDADLRAMATFLATPAPPSGDTAHDVEARTTPGTPGSLGARLYDGACAACHQPGRGAPLFGVRPSLALNSNLHAATPDTLVRVVLHGIPQPALPALGAMPGFAASFDDAQVAALVRYLRAQFAPGQPAWTGIEDAVARLRG